MRRNLKNLREFQNAYRLILLNGPNYLKMTGNKFNLIHQLLNHGYTTPPAAQATLFHASILNQILSTDRYLLFAHLLHIYCNCTGITRYCTVLHRSVLRHKPFLIPLIVLSEQIRDNACQNKAHSRNLNTVKRNQTEKCKNADSDQQYHEIEHHCKFRKLHPESTFCCRIHYIKI